ncbi:hypothetical protein Nepgr_026001 [Nepenthes gracilis]|uniref:Uncharacterized protein n=1 Tax=Nepenthes gracilis TaxID=150966 RepID=A0AAD3T796_NEPGR|nr:hypothetical protein Nepgr_026001 [Nepenthes gracilis]
MIKLLPLRSRSVWAAAKLKYGLARGPGWHWVLWVVILPASVIRYFLHGKCHAPDKGWRYPDAVGYSAVCFLIHYGQAILLPSSIARLKELICCSAELDL